jgi:hypothetical protein
VGNYLKKLLSRKEPGRAESISSDPVKDPDLIRIFDVYGREMFITRQQWRNNVLPGNIKESWNKPDDLYNLIYSALWI